MFDLSRSTGLGVDLLDADAVRAAVRDAAPDVVHHLAARAHVGESWREPEAYLRDNAAMTLHLLEAVREEAPEAAVVVVGSSELYGPPASLPVDESAPLAPQNPYAVSKASADLLAGFFADAHGLRIIRARAFNHAGPGQEPIYAIASFARQIAAGIERGEDPIRVVTGNPDARRDYTDVRDVVRAYRELAAGAEPGIYNICSGRPASAAELLSALGRVTGVARRPRGRPEAAARARGDGGARRLRAAARSHRLGARDQPRADARGHRDVVARGDPRRARRRPRARMSGSLQASNSRPGPFPQNSNGHHQQLHARTSS